MKQIRLLDKHIAELIAAGEVVDRPSSVIKELLENSIDAGASAITVEIKNGGATYMRITDNGCGIPRGEVPVAFLRHATSKIKTEDDLEQISTLGFRGEALPSIASVARVEMITKTSGEEIGTRYVIEGGEESVCDDAGCPSGTTIIVRDLFFNTPARMKFLRKDVTEAAQISAVIDKLAMSHPEVSFRYIRDSKTVCQTPGDGNIFPAVRIILGKEAADVMLPVSYECDGMSVTGFVSRPSAARSNRNLQNFFINGRYVRTKTGVAAIEQAYKNRMMTGKFPYCVLFLTIPCNTVDVNVHPSKTEVRFTNEQPVFQLLYYAVKSALDNGDSLAGAPVKPSLNTARSVDVSAGQSFLAKSSGFDNLPAANDTKSAFVSVAPGKTFTLSDSGKHSDFGNYAPAAAYIPAAPTAKIDISVDDEPEKKAVAEGIAAEACADAPNDAGDGKNPVRADAQKIRSKLIDNAILPDRVVRVIGEVFKTYIICQLGDELYYIDKHAAHERIIFNSLKTDAVPQTQVLLSPISIVLSKEEYAALLENVPAVESCGFEIEDFGIGTILVRSAPSYIEAGEIKAVIEEIAGYLLDNKRTIMTEKLDWIYHSVSCRAAIKGGDNSALPELQNIAERVLFSDDILYCPHGRPVAVRVTRHQLEKLFGRVQ